MNSPLKYIGGKSKLSETIIKMIPEHHAYCEVFAGAAWVFFRKEPSKYETINDLDSDLISFYRVLQIKAKFILSINDLPEMRKAFQSFKIKPVELKYSVSTGKQATGKELLISNF